MKVVTLTLPRLPKTEDKEMLAYAQSVNRFLQDLNTKTGTIIFNNSDIVDVPDTGAANVEFAIAHKLGRVPEHAYLTFTDKAGVLYKGATAWTDKMAYLKFSVADAEIKVVLA